MTQRIKLLMKELALEIDNLNTKIEEQRLVIVELNNREKMYTTTKKKGIKLRIEPAEIIPYVVPIKHEKPIYVAKVLQYSDMV